MSQGCLHDEGDPYAEETYSDLVGVRQGKSTRLAPRNALAIPITVLVGTSARVCRLRSLHAPAFTVTEVKSLAPAPRVLLCCSQRLHSPYRPRRIPACRIGVPILGWVQTLAHFILTPRWRLRVIRFVAPATLNALLHIYAVFRRLKKNSRTRDSLQ